MLRRGFVFVRSEVTIVSCEISVGGGDVVVHSVPTVPHGLLPETPP